MASRSIINLNNNDDLITVIKKCNTNFKLIISQSTKQGQIQMDDLNNTIMDINDEINNLAPVATSGDYDDLINTPTIPPGVVVDSQLDSDSTNPVENGVITDALDDKVDTSGDSMTGDLDMMNKNVRAASLNSSMTRNSGNPSFDTESNGYKIVDTFFQDLVKVGARRETDGTMFGYLRAFNDVSGVETTEEIRVGLDRNGDAKYYITTPSALLKALGLVTDVDNSTSYIGTSSSWTLWSAEKRTFGNVVTVLLQAYSSSALTAGTTYHVGNVPSAWRPTTTINGTCSDGIAILTDTGSFSVLPFRTVASNTILKIYFTFII